MNPASFAGTQTTLFNLFQEVHKMGTGELILLIVMGGFTITVAILMRDEIKDWFKRQHWHLMGVFDNECPHCHRRYRYKSDMESCRCATGREDDRGIGAQAPWEKFHGGSGWPFGL